MLQLPRENRLLRHFTLYYTLSCRTCGKCADHSALMCMCIHILKIQDKSYYLSYHPQVSITCSSSIDFACLASFYNFYFCEKVAQSSTFFVSKTSLLSYKISAQCKSFCLQNFVNIRRIIMR